MAHDFGAELHGVPAPVDANGVLQAPGGHCPSVIATVTEQGVTLIEVDHREHIALYARKA